MASVFVWVNSDLDGVGSTILLGNIFPKFEYRSVFFGDFERQYDEWYENNFTEFDKIFIVGMVLDQKLVNQLDEDGIIFVDDRGNNLNTVEATIIQDETSSCTKLLYKTFKDKVNFPKNLKKLFAYIDDYNSYELKTEEAKYINAIYRKSWGGKFQRFVNRFWKGFDGFTDKEISIAEKFFSELEEELAGLTLYQGEFKGAKVISTFSGFSVNEIAGGIMDAYDCDVVIVLNLSTKFVSFRRSVGSDVDIQYMAEYLCDGGGGEWASGGQITPRFLKFTEKLEEI